MVLYRQTIQSLYQQALNDILSSNLSGIDTGLLPDAILSLLAWNNSLMAYGNYGFIEACLAQCTPFTATGVYLRAWGSLKRVTQTLATQSQGSATGTGTPVTDIPVGTILYRSDGFQYSTFVDSVVDVNGNVTINFESVTAGAAGNIDIAAYNGSLTLSLQSPITGLSSSFIVTNNIVGGADEENVEAYRTRVLAAFSQPASGGSLSDYQGWLLAIPGVTRAWENPTIAPYPGSIVLYAMFDDAEQSNQGFPVGSNGVAPLEDRWPIKATGDQLTIANYIFNLQPATDTVFVVAPLPQVISYEFASITPDTTANRTAITNALNALFIAKGTPLGSTISTAVQYAAITSVSTLTDFSFIVQPTDIVTTLGYLPVLGNVTVGE